MTVKCPCSRCGNNIAYESEHEGEDVGCPHCGSKTKLKLPTARIYPEEIFAKPKRNWSKIAAITAIVVFILFLVGMGAKSIFDSLYIIFGLCWFALGMIIYFAPAIMARKRKNFNAIFVLNLFLGWTFVGWVVALVWANMEDK